jgi:hypothetical protein
MIPDHWTDGLELLDEKARHQVVPEQIARANSAPVAEALARVHDAARDALKSEGHFGYFLLAAGAAVLQGWQVSEGIEIYRQLATHVRKTAGPGAGDLRFALRDYLLTQQVNAQQV